MLTQEKVDEKNRRKEVKNKYIGWRNYQVKYGSGLTTSERDIEALKRMYRLPVKIKKPTGKRQRYVPAEA